jgi:hypothetical protein
MIELVERKYSLLILLLPEGREWLQEHIEDGAGDEAHDILEQARYAGNGWSCAYDQVTLWGGPAIAKGVEIDGNGKMVDSEELYYYPDYNTTSWKEVLLRDGWVSFQKAPKDGE